MRRRVTRAKIHDIQIVVPGVGQLERELPPINKKVKMDLFLDTEYPGVLLVNIGSHELFVPLANVQIGFMAPEEKPAIKPKN